MKRLRMAKRYSTAGISKNLSYTIREIHEIRGTAPQTIRKYIREEGLPAMTSQKPFLIHGADYIDFMERKRKGNGKGPLEPGSFKCFTCTHRGPPMGNMGDLETVPRRRITALCGACERPVGMYIGEAKLAQYCAVLDIATASPL